MAAAKVRHTVLAAYRRLSAAARIGLGRSARARILESLWRDMHRLHNAHMIACLCRCLYLTSSRNVRFVFSPSSTSTSTTTTTTTTTTTAAAAAAGAGAASAGAGVGLPTTAAPPAAAGAAPAASPAAPAATAVTTAAPAPAAATERSYDDLDDFLPGTNNTYHINGTNVQAQIVSTAFLDSWGRGMGK